MVDTGDTLHASFELILHAQPAQQAFGANLHAVAQTDRFDLRVPLHIAGQHRHGVGVVEEPRVGTNLLHIAREIAHNRDRAQCAHDAADAQCIGNRLPQSVFLRHLKINDRTGVIEAHLDRVDHKIRTAQRFLAVFHAEVSLDRRPLLVYVFVDCVQNDRGFLQTHRVNVVQRDFRIAQRRRAHTVAQHIPGKHRAARAHKRNFHHASSSLLLLFV